MSDNNIQININSGDKSSSEKDDKQKMKDKRMTYLGIILPSLITGLFGLLYVIFGWNNDKLIDNNECVLKKRISSVSEKLTDLLPNYKSDETETVILEGYISILNSYYNNKRLCKNGKVDEDASKDLNDAIKRYGL